MPGPRRRKPPKHNFPPLELPQGSSEPWIQEWIEYGFTLISDRLSKQMEFENYCRDHPQSDQQEEAQ